MKFTRLVLIAVLSYIFGYYLGNSILHAQTTQNERVHLNSNNTVVMRGVMNEDSVLDVQLRLAKLVVIRGFKDYPIYLVLDSPGGDVDAGRSLIEFAKVIDDLNTITISAASMAAMTVECLPGKRLMTNSANLMFHRAAATIGGQFETGELESRLEFIKSEVRTLEETISKRLGLPLLVYKAKIHDEMWLSARNAIKQHAADKVVDIICSDELTDKRVDVTQESIFGSATMSFSGCPTLRSPVAAKSEKSI